MMNVRVLCVGRLKESFYEEACREYEKRLKGLCRLEIVELKEESGEKKARDASLRKGASR